MRMSGDTACIERPLADEAFWVGIRAAYPAQEPLLNLNNAAVGVPPLVVEQAFLEACRFVTHNPDFNMWSHLDTALPAIKGRLAGMAGCGPQEVALNRNATESLCTAIFGIPLAAGERVIVGEWDYPSMRAAWHQRRVREGIEIITVRFDPMASDEEVIASYLGAFADRVRVLHLTHMLHWTGRILPVERLCRSAREAGIVTIVDGAQSFAQMPVSFRALGCDYFASSLHKWLGAPVGNGMLIVKEDRIEETWPLLAPFDEAPVGIAKFDHWNLGTYPSAVQAGIIPAIELHASIGTSVISARLRELSRYWVELARGIPGFTLHTPGESLMGVSLFSVAGYDPRRLEQILRQRFRVHTKYRECGELRGIRVSPGIYTTKEELGQFVKALEQVVAESGAPSRSDS